MAPKVMTTPKIEANCKICPEIKRCKHENHPLANQTSSKGPRYQTIFLCTVLHPHFHRFPDYVCLDEPCGECSDSNRYPCGNSCIPLTEICPLSGLCSSSMFQCGDLCIPLAAACDGKVDCVDGSDEESCVDKSGAWLCHGAAQPRSQPCL